MYKSIKYITILFGLFLMISQSKMMAGDTQAQITFHITTDEGKPLVNFPYQAGSYLFHPVKIGSSDNTVNVNALTDQNGNVTITLPSATGEINSGTPYGIKGYYANGFNYHFQTNSEGKWQPWNLKVDLMIKPINNPIPMYAKAVRLSLPAKNTPIGFDLQIGDWVAPYGKGTSSDFIFTLVEKIPFLNGRKPYDMTNTLSFTNKGDGIQSVLPTLDPISSIRMLCEAPESNFTPTLTQELALRGRQRISGADAEDQNYFFRIRTILDESGKVKSALYGKIMGPLLCGPQGYVQFTYYLNPTPNDRNMEFDPTKNLFQNLTDDQQVRAP